MKPGVPGDCWAECKQLRPCNAMYIVGPCIIVCCRLYEHRSILTARLPTAKPAHYSNRLCSQYAWTSRNFSYLLSCNSHTVYICIQFTRAFFWRKFCTAMVSCMKLWWWVGLDLYSPCCKVLQLLSDSRPAHTRASFNWSRIYKKKKRKIHAAVLLV